MSSPVPPSKPAANLQRPDDKKPADKKMGDQKKGDSRGRAGFISRVKSVLTRADSSTSGARRSTSKAASSTSTSTAASKAKAADASTVATQPAGSYVAVTIQLPPKTAHQRAAEARARYEAMHGVTTLAKSALFEERARTLSQRFGLDLHATRWQNPVSVSKAQDDAVRRIDKPIRLRIRRTCHRCNTAFASSKECPGCEHVRCTQCTRYPPTRTDAELAASRQKRAAIVKANKDNAPIVIDWSWSASKAAPLQRPSKSGGGDLVLKKARQRVRRNCHECGKLFQHGSKTCEGCQHVRCTDCPRDPSKKDKYPLGYPGDVFGEASIPHYECEQCQTLYPAAARDGAQCTECKTPKSDRSPRALPRKMDPPPIDGDAVTRIQAKLRSMAIV